MTQDSKVSAKLREGLDKKIGTSALDENAKSGYPSLMTRKKLAGFLALPATLLMLRSPVFADMPSMPGMNPENSTPAAAPASQKKQTVHATDTGEKSALDTAINKASKELGRESQECKKNPKVCAQGKISKEIAGFICKNNFDSLCATSKNEKTRLAAAIATDISGIANPEYQARMAELSVVIADKNGNPQLVKACANGKSPTHQCQGWTGSGSGELTAWLTGFLASAGEKAHALLWSDINATKASIDKNSAPNSNETHVPGSSAEKNTDAAALSKSFNWKDLYVDGAVTQWVVTDPQTNAGRQISIKMYTTRDPNPPHGLTQQVGVFDYTKPGGPNEPSYIYGRRYSTGGDQDVAITLDPDGPKFHLTIKKGDVSFSAEGNPQPQIHTSIATLATLRQNQVQARGYEEKIGNQTFKVIGQGGANGTLLFFPTDKNGNVSADPEAIAQANEVGSDGFVHNLKSAPYETALGPFPTGKDGADQFYYMKISKAPDGSEYFEPMVCDDAIANAENPPEKCDFPPPPPDKNAQGDQAGNSGSSNSNKGGTFSGCSGKTAKTWNGQTFFPSPSGDGFDVCVNGAQGLIAVPGIPQSFTDTGSNLVIKTAIPDDSAKPDSISAEYDTLEENWSYQSDCNKVGGSKPCEATTPDGKVVLTHEKDYSISKGSLANLTEQSSADKIAHIIIRYDLQGQEKGTQLQEIEIKASTPDDANSAWGAYLKTAQTPPPYADQISAFIETLKDKGTDSKSPFITINTRIASEIKSLKDQQAVIVKGFNGEKLTAADLTGQRTPSSKPKKSKKSETKN